MSSHADDDRHWDGTCRYAILPPPPETEWRQEMSHVADPLGFWMPVRVLPHWLLGGFTVLMLAAAWITFLCSEARA